MPVSAARSVDLIVVGGGAVGLASALAATQRNLVVHLIAEHRSGEASPAAAGMLAPTVELADTPSAAHEFALAARDRYPSFLTTLRELSGITVPQNRLGILQLADTPDANSEWLDQPALTDVEPALAHAPGARYYRDDGAVNNVMLLDALEIALARSPHIHRTTATARGIHLNGHGVTVHTSAGAFTAPKLLLAAGAWVTQLEGLPRPLPIEPVRGQMLALRATPLRHVVYAQDGYLVPRTNGEILVGSTMEHVAYDASTTTTAGQHLRATADAICPALADAPTIRQWAGLRPMTPDGLPIIGPDPDHPALLYAVGHSRNGVLLAPLTGDCIAALATDATPPAELRPFSIDRFANFHK
jgi:glycine oxidase